MTDLTLYSYWRSSAAWRVRLGLAHKGLSFTTVPKHFLRAEHKQPEFLALNPQGLIPALALPDGTVLSQSLAILEYLDEVHPEPPLLPRGAAERARVRAMAQLIACDIHPLNNLRVLQFLRVEFDRSDAEITEWYRHWIIEGFKALEPLVRAAGDGRHCFGERITLADLCLIPQMGNARRYSLDLSPYPTLVAIDAAIAGRPDFAAAAPSAQPDAEG